MSPVPSPELSEAVTAEVHREAETLGGTRGLVVTEFVVVASASGWDDEGHEVSQVVIVPSGMNHRIMGLLREAVVRSDAEALAAYMVDDG